MRLWHCCPERHGCPILGGPQSQSGWGSGQPDLLGGSQPTAQGWSLMILKVSSNPIILWFLTTPIILWFSTPSIILLLFSCSAALLCMWEQSFFSQLAVRGGRGAQRKPTAPSHTEGTHHSRALHEGTIPSALHRQRRLRWRGDRSPVLWWVKGHNPHRAGSAWISHCHFAFGLLYTVWSCKLGILHRCGCLWLFSFPSPRLSPLHTCWKLWFYTLNVPRWDI